MYKLDDASTVELAKDPRTNSATLMILVGHSWFVVRANVASHSNTPINGLMKLATDNMSIVRHRVASNPNTPIKTVIKLSYDEDELVKSSALANPNIPLDRLRESITDNSWHVRNAIYHNRSSTEDIILLLLASCKIAGWQL